MNSVNIDPCEKHIVRLTQDSEEILPLHFSQKRLIRICVRLFRAESNAEKQTRERCEQ